MALEQILISASAGLANILGVGMLVPQALRIAKTRSAEGVSGAWVGAGISINMGWFMYGLDAEVRGLLPVSGGSLILYIWILRLLAPAARGAAREAGLVVVGVLTLLGLASALTDTSGLGLTLSALYTVQFAPAAWTAVRETNLNSVSMSTWVLAVAEAMLWTVYGTAIDDLPVALGGAGATLMSALILFRLCGERQDHSVKFRRRAALSSASTSPKTHPTAPLDSENT